MIKKCNDCGMELDKDTMFHKKSAGRCIPCYKLARSKKYLENIDSLREKGRNNYYNMSDEQRELSKIKKNEYNINNKDKILEKNRKWHHDNKDRLKSEGRYWNDNNKDRIKEKQKLRNSTPEGKLKRLIYQREYYKKNKEKIKLKDKNWESIPKNKIARRLRSRVRNALKRNITGAITKKLESNKNLLGISFDESVKHLESLFSNNMGWDNYGEWHIDHIIPCSHFDLTLIENQRICFNYQNLQPLWGIENLSKNDNILINSPEEFIDNIRQSL